MKFSEKFLFEEPVVRRDSENVETENVSDEGIDDGDADSDSGAATNDYLVSSVSKADLELISKDCSFSSDRSLFLIVNL